MVRGRWCHQACRGQGVCGAVSVPSVHPRRLRSWGAARHTPLTPTPTLTQASALIKEVEKTFGLNDDEDDDKAEE